MERRVRDAEVGLVSEVGALRALGGDLHARPANARSGRETWNREQRREGRSSSGVRRADPDDTFPVALVTLALAVLPGCGAKSWLAEAPLSAAPSAGMPSPIAVGCTLSCAVVDGGAQCWGGNGHGQLGDGSTADSPVPVRVAGLAGVVAVAAGSYHACALAHGGVQCWGLGGRLGDGSRKDSPVPTQVVGLTSGVQAIAAGAFGTCALVHGGVRCWGGIGNDERSPGPVPVPVAGLPGGVEAIAVGDHHACALVSGALWCWRNNFWGGLGSNAPSIKGSPVPVGVVDLGSDAHAIAAGHVHSCALVNVGVECWGNAFNGEAASDVPVPVAGLTGGVVEALAAGGFNTCAVVDGAARCWGNNGLGALGDVVSARRQRRAVSVKPRRYSARCCSPARRSCASRRAPATRCPRRKPRRPTPAPRRSPSPRAPGQAGWSSVYLRRRSPIVDASPTFTPGQGGGASSEWVSAGSSLGTTKLLAVRGEAPWRARFST